MTGMFHIEGMGLAGCSIAWRLYQMGIPFTWHDTRERYNAWQASTGCIYPSGDALDMACWQDWLKWANGGVGWFTEIPNVSEVANYWFASKHPPHQSKSQPVIDLGPVRLHPLLSVHFNVQTFVQSTRRFFIAHESTPVTNARVIVAHGFNQRSDRVLWGWSQMAALKFSDVFDAGNTSLRHCLYLRSGRYIFDYAYPVPGYKYYYIGTSLISQKMPKPLETFPKQEKFLARFKERFAGLIDIAPVGIIRQGWRPVARKDDSPAWFIKQDGKLIVKPLHGSGSRHMPAVLDALEAML